MGKFFISHSKRDKELVNAMAKVLRNIKHDPIIEELIPEEEKENVPYEEIRKNVNQSDHVFLFLTDNIVLTEYTRNWVSFEVGLTASEHKKLLVFERSGVPVPYPIPYLTDYMIFDEDNTSDILDIQNLATKLNELSKTTIGAGIGASLGFVFGPMGLILGGLGGALLGAKAEEEIPKVKCPFCGVSYFYHSPHHTSFNCPACRNDTKIEIGGD